MFAAIDLNIFAAICLGLTLLFQLLRRLITTAPKQHGNPAVEQDNLRPAELAYLARHGDMSAVMVVLAFDLLHRAVKLAQAKEESLNLAPYEEQAWESSKNLVRHWMSGQASNVLPDIKKESLPEITRKVTRLHHFATKTMKTFVSDIIADPKRIKRYISYAGVARLVADLFSCGYQQTLKTGLQAHLLSQGLLVSPGRLSRRSRLLQLISVITWLSLLVLLIFLLSKWPIAALIFTAATLNSIALSLLFFFVDLIPLYAEIKDVLTHMKEGGVRVKLAKIAVALLSIMVTSLFALASLVILLVEAGAFSFVYAGGVPQLMAILALSTLCSYFPLAVFAENRRWANEARPSLEASNLIARKKRELSECSPIAAFNTALASDDYDPLFSQMLAIYGIETLWLLG